MAQANAQSSAFSVVIPTLAALLFLAALVAMVCAVSLAFPSPFWIPMWNLNPAGYEAFHHLGLFAVAFLFAMSVICATAAAGLLLRRRWAWWIALLLFAANGTGDVISLIRTRDTLRFGSGILIAAAFIALLNLPAVRRSFRRTA